MSDAPSIAGYKEPSPDKKTIKQYVKSTNKAATIKLKKTELDFSDSKTPNNLLTKPLKATANDHIKTKNMIKF